MKTFGQFVAEVEAEDLQEAKKAPSGMLHFTVKHGDTKRQIHAGYHRYTAGDEADLNRAKQKVIDTVNKKYPSKKGHEIEFNARVGDKQGAPIDPAHKEQHAAHLKAVEKEQGEMKTVAGVKVSKHDYRTMYGMVHHSSHDWASRTPESTLKKRFLEKFGAKYLPIYNYLRTSDSDTGRGLGTNNPHLVTHKTTSK